MQTELDGCIIMRVYTVHKKRVVTLSMAAGTVLLLVTMATVHQDPLSFLPNAGTMDFEEDGSRNAVRWKGPRYIRDWKNSEGADEYDDAGNEHRNEVMTEGTAVSVVRQELEEEETNGIGTVDGDYDEYEANGGEENDEEDEENDNPVFREGDFDSTSSRNNWTDWNTTVEEIEDVALPTLEAEQSDSQGAEMTTDAVVVMPTTAVDQKTGSFSSEHILDRRLQGNPESEVIATTAHSVTVSSMRRSTESHTYRRELSLLSKNLSSGRQSRRTRRNRTTVKFVEDSQFWSREVEKLLPKGLSPKCVKRLQTRLRQLPVLDLSPPMWNRCGRPKNQFVTLSDGSHACARYRAPHDYLVQGEVLSFYLARLLSINNVPTVVLSIINPTSSQWGGHDSAEPTPAMTKAGWEVNGTVAFIQWIDALERDKMPNILLNALTKGKTITWATKSLQAMPPKKLVELAQWSDLIVFDYITGNYDRVASMQDAAEKERSPDILHDTIHNLVKSRRGDGGLWLIDNESGLLDAYSLMYAQNHPSQGKRFVDFQRQMLRTMCIFRRSTFSRVQFLSRRRTAHTYLMAHVHKREPLFKRLPDVMGHKEFVKHFQERIDEVYSWMINCRNSSTIESM